MKQTRKLINPNDNHFIQIKIKNKNLTILTILWKCHQRSELN